MSRLLAPLALALSLILTGCSDTKRIEENLGDWRFIGRSPQIKIAVLKMETKRATESYERDKIELTGVLEQVGDFPLKNFFLTGKLAVDLNGKELGKQWLQVELKDGKAAFNLSVSLGEHPKGATIPHASLSISPKDVSWYPSRDITKNVSVEVVRMSDG